MEPAIPVVARAAGAGRRSRQHSILHPNALTPQTARITAEIIRAVFDERHVAIFEGDVEVANTLLELPVDHIFFTGSPGSARS